LAAASRSDLASAKLAARFGRRRALSIAGLDLALAGPPGLLVASGLTERCAVSPNPSVHFSPVAV
jgi:hypothetical protein